MTKTLVKAPSKAELDRAYAAILDREPIPSAGDPEIVSRAILERIASAETFEEAFAPQQLEGWRNYLDVPVKVHEFHLNPTAYTESEASASVYAVVDLERLDGKDPANLTVTCGGRNVLMQLVKALEKGWLDRPVRLTSKRTAEGFDALWLVAA